MNILKSSSGFRLIAFLLVASVLICTFGFVADGWHLSDGTNGNGSHNQSGNQNNESSGLENGNNETDNTPSTALPENTIPEFINNLTGTECTEEIANTIPVSFIMSTSSPLYGVSSSDILIEFPIENGTTRVLSFISDYQNLGKVGSLASNRGYISNLAKNFGAILASVGCDDTIEYDRSDLGDFNFDLTSKPNYYYTEFSKYTYTNGDLINSYFSSLDDLYEKKANLPYDFPDFNSEKIKGSSTANRININYSSSNNTSLYYNKDNGLYTFENTTTKRDALNNKIIEFKNCFVLFADSVTHESSSSSELILNTIGQGIGYYFTEGTWMQISWSADISGDMFLYTSNGNKLTINRGNSYIAFVKSSRTSDVNFS